MTDWKKIRQEWETTSITFVDLAEKHNIKTSTVRSRKNREKWQRNATQRKNVATQKKNVAKKNEPIADEVKSVMENDDLNDKQRLFCLYYSRSFNATKSYQKAYDVDYITACASGPRLLKNVRVKDEITRLKEQRYSRELLRPEDIFQKYMDIAFADITDYVIFGNKEIKIDDNDINVNYVDVKESSQVDGAILSEVKQGREGVSVKLNDRMKALQWLTDHMDMATEEQKARIDKLEADTKYTKEKTKLLQGEKKDLTHLEELFRVMRDD